MDATSSFSVYSTHEVDVGLALVAIQCRIKENVGAALVAIAVKLRNLIYTLSGFSPERAQYNSDG